MAVPGHTCWKRVRGAGVVAVVTAADVPAEPELDVTVGSVAATVVALVGRRGLVAFGEKGVGAIVFEPPGCEQTR